MDNPDYEGHEGARLRREAQECAQERSRLFDAATVKRNAKDHKGANELAEEGKRMGEKMKQKNREAAKAILYHNNGAKGKGDDQLDLHGLREEEAMEFLSERFRKLERSTAIGSVVDFTVIPGAGHHSGPAGQKLKSATVRFFDERHIGLTQLNEGSFLAQVPGKARADTAAKPSEPIAAAAPEQKTESSSCCVIM